MDIASKIPFYAKIALIFIGASAFVFTLYIGQEIILPLVFAALINHYLLLFLCVIC